MATTESALTVAEQVEQSVVVRQLDAQTSALAAYLPDEEAVERFRRGVILAILKNPELLECTPSSMVLAVFEAAQMGLEPVREAHFVPRRINVGTREKPRYEKQAQMIPDYRGVIRLVTKPGSEVASIEARVVREGDEFEYELGSDAWVKHKPSKDPKRSTKAGTHYYTVARLRSGGPPLVDVEDRAGIERIKARAHPAGFSPWSSDFDEMGKKTMVKRHGKVLPVPPDVRAILAREDEIAGELASGDVPAALPPGPSKVSQLAARLRPGTAPAQDAPGASDPAPAPTDITETADAAASPDAGDETAVADLSREELLDALADLGVSASSASEKAKDVFPDRPANKELTRRQRAELLAAIRAELAADEAAGDTASDAL